MARRVVLDTGVLIAFERGRLDIDRVLGADDGAIAAITAMELLVGVERAEPTHRQARAIHVEGIIASMAIESYSLDVARVHARLAAHAMSVGKSRSMADTIIAATAVATGRVLLTTDAAAAFDQFPGVRSEVVA